MSDENLSIEYYKKDKELRDVVQDFHEMLDARYKEVSIGLKSLYQAQTKSKASDVMANDDNGEAGVKEQQMGSTTMLHVAAEVHQEDRQQCVDNPGFALGPEDVAFSPEHDVALEKIKEGIQTLFGTNFTKDRDKSDPNVEDNGTRIIHSGKGNPVTVDGIAPHLCTVAWVKTPKRYQECTAVVRTVGPENVPLVKGGADVKGTLSWSRYDKQFCKIKDNDDGTYHILYSACSVRYHLLHVTINGHDVAGTPFIVDVDDDDSWE